MLSGQRVRLIARFEHYADARVPYMMHCHLLRHEDVGMMGQFPVTADGTGPDRLGGGEPDGESGGTGGMDHSGLHDSPASP